MVSNDERKSFPENPMMGSLNCLSNPLTSSIPLQSTSPNPSSHSFHSSAEELTIIPGPELESLECNNCSQSSSFGLSSSHSQADEVGKEDEKGGEFVDNEESTSATSPLPLPEVSFGFF